MENPFRICSQGEYRYDGSVQKYVVTGYDIRRFVGTGTAIENVGRPLHPTKTTTWGARCETLWATEKEAEAAAARINAGETDPEISFCSYSND